jgi:hypothetical protein
MGEVAGNVLPSYNVAGDWCDVVENTDGVWVSVADGLGGGTRATASSAVALGVLRASRRGGGRVENVAYMRGRDGIEVQARSGWLIMMRDGETTSLTLYQTKQEALEAAGLSE